MAPTSGGMQSLGYSCITRVLSDLILVGQYHWVSEFAPRKYQRFLSYIVGMDDESLVLVGLL